MLNDVLTKPLLNYHHSFFLFTHDSESLPQYCVEVFQQLNPP
ncbi:hypothetical protein BTN49_3006 [Candidatus Enterovibrio escicola]|uniref:Uncharacterized protein n=1 Tax=Candidatus Enterovibrio escicola TaxID=1927127 RepID=A0A2A5SZZ4_9GAMM|nr:hypothetical protein BTN49_3006 [Candidatus Enterovibrio escacola]